MKERKGKKRIKQERKRIEGRKKTNKELSKKKIIERTLLICSRKKLTSQARSPKNQQ